MSARTTTILLLAGGLGLAAWLLGAFDPPTAHIAALIPDDSPFAVVTSSLNDLRKAYEGKYAPRDADPARARFGQPVNVPGLDGFDYDRPAGYFSQEGRLVYLVPVVDEGAFESAHSEARENIHAQRPVRVAKHYLSVADSDAVAVVGPDNRWILEAAGHPLALVGRPDDAPLLRGMLVSFFGPDPLPRVRNAEHVSTIFARMPPRVADPMAAEMTQMRLALLEREQAGRQVRFDLLAEPSAQSHLARAAPYARDARVAEILGYFPAGNRVQTVLGVSWLLDGEGWRAFGAPFDVGAAAAALGIVELKFRAGRNALVFALAPTDAQRLDSFTLAPPDAESRTVDEVTMRVWKVPVPPAPFASILQSDAAEPPPLYACSARAADVWFCTLGAHAEEVMRTLLHAATGASQKSMRFLVGDENRRVAPTRAHGKFFDPGRLAIGFLDARVQRALDFPLPYIPMAAIGQPEAITFTLTHSDGRFWGDLRCFVADGE